MYSKRENIEIIFYDKGNEVIKELFYLLTKRYQTGLEKSLTDSDFVFHCINLMHCISHKINLNRGS